MAFENNASHLNFISVYLYFFQTRNTIEYQSGGHADKQGHSETDGADEAWREAAKVTN